MKQTITVNGVAYDSVEAMPPDVRRVYDQARVRFAGVGKAGTGDPIVLHGQAGPLKITTTVQKSVAVNGTTYENEAAMPPGVRETYATAMREVRSGDPASTEGGLRMALVLGACAVIGLAAWLFLRAR